MIIADSCFLECINSPVRRVKGRVELYEGSTLLDTYNATDRLKSFTIERTTNENKFFGYGICQKLQVKLRDKERAINITKSNSLEAIFGTKCDYTYTNPIFYVKEINRNENTNELTVTAYDALYEASAHTVDELDLEAPYTIEIVAAACAALLGLPFQTQNVNDGSFDTVYTTGANFSGSETIREVLDAIAEATQTIYFIDHNWELTFKRLDVAGAPVTIIDKSKYFTLEKKEPYTVSAVCHATELGDNVIAGTVGGTVQYVRDNPFWDLRNDIGSLVNKALAAIKGLTITQFNCSWRGNYLVEPGDKISIIAKDGSTITSYLLDDTISYNGALVEKSEWSYSENEGETAANPTTLGDSLKQTFARVDKANQRIDLVASETAANSEHISQLNISTGEISASVERVEQTAQDNFDSVTEDIVTLTQKVEATMTAEDVTIAIQNEMSNGVNKVTTTTGFTFNEEGLTVSKSGSEMTTQITEDGMSVYRDGNEVLTADNTGVKAENLHATTYLIIGVNSRFEDYEGNRTGCFWIGG